MPRPRETGLTLIELLIVVGIIGVIAALAIPNLLNAIDRAKQKRTMADLRSLGTAVQAYSVDNNFYPSAASMSALDAEVAPDYIRATTKRDGWGVTFYVDCSAVSYTLASCGKGATSCSSVSITAGGGSGGAATSFTDDIVYSNNLFVQWPEGTQL
jgi:general secretion pathway protein G